MLPLPSSGQCHYSVAFSPDGRWLAAGGSAHAADVWDLHAPQNLARRLADMHDPIIRVQFTAGSLFVVSSSWVRRFDGGTLALVGARNLGNIRRVVAAPDGATVIVSDGALRRRSVDLSTAPRLDWSLEDISGGIADVALTEQGEILAAHIWPTGGSLIDVREPGRGDLLDSVPVSGPPHRIACSADGSRAAILANGNLSVWDLVAQAPLADRTSPVHGGWLSVAFDLHGRRIVTGGIDSTVAVWDAASNGPPLTTFQWGVGPVYAVTFDRDGLRAAAAGHSGAVVWDVDE
jgi:WD40 repeat protein